jgi:hypothetical protein
VSSGVNNHVGALFANGRRLYVGGGFAQVCGNSPCISGNQTVDRIALWNGIGWSSFANGLNNDVWVLAVNGSDAYAGGYLSAICGTAACRSVNTLASDVARCDGSNWSSLGIGINIVDFAAMLGSGLVRSTS